MKKNFARVDQKLEMNLLRQIHLHKTKSHFFILIKEILKICPCKGLILMDVRVRLGVAIKMQWFR